MKKGNKVFNSHYYEGSYDKKGHYVKLHFKTEEDYHRFLNWWVLGKLDKPQKKGDMP